jgi:hypothetical protein
MLDELDGREAVLLISICFQALGGKATHMWAAHAGPDAFRIFGPNTGEYRIPRRDPNDLVTSLTDRYVNENSQILEMQALEVKRV